MKISVLNEDPPPALHSCPSSPLLLPPPQKKEWDDRSRTPSLLTFTPWELNPKNMFAHRRIASAFSHLHGLSEAQHKRWRDHCYRVNVCVVVLLNSQQCLQCSDMLVSSHLLQYWEAPDHHCFVHCAASPTIKKHQGDSMNFSGKSPIGPTDEEEEHLTTCPCDV